MSLEPLGPAVGSAPDVFDYQGLCERLNGRHELVDQLVKMVLSEYGTQRERIALRVDVEDGAGLIEAAHRLKGQLLTVGVNAAADVARRIEECGRQGRPLRALPVLAELDCEMQRFEMVVNARWAQAGTGQPR